MRFLLKDATVLSGTGHCLFGDDLSLGFGYDGRFSIKGMRGIPSRRNIGSLCGAACNAFQRDEMLAHRTLFLRNIWFFARNSLTEVEVAVGFADAEAVEAMWQQLKQPPHLLDAPDSLTCEHALLNFSS